MLSEKGGTGFPTLMFLDAEGRRLLKHAGPRTVKAFESTLAEVEQFQALMQKAEAGDAKAATELFIRQLQLEWFESEEAQAKAAALQEVSSAQKKQIDQLLVDTEVRCRAAAAGKDMAKVREAGAHFLEMWEAKRVPASEDQLYVFWAMMARHAEDKGDKKLFKKIVGAFKDTIPGSSRYRPALGELQERLKNM